MKPMDFAKKAAANKAIDYLLEDPEHNIEKMMETINSIVPEALFPAQRKAFTNAISSKNNYYQLLMRVKDLDQDYASRFAKIFLTEANLIAWGQQEKSRDKYKCNIPWAILLDPTSACNLRCTGCWAAEYGHKLNLTYEDIDSIICQGKELGVHVYIYTGGEPLVRKDDLIRLCDAHRDCAFLCFTNATLIDEAFVDEIARVSNFVPIISAEGDEESTDSRRGAGTYKKIDHAMGLLHKRGLVFGVSICFTSVNAASVCSDEYIDWLIEKGAFFAWIFTYMPVGKDSPADLMPSPEQREALYRFNKHVRADKPFFTLDFQNDGEYVGGCVAGGRRYLHINAAGDVEPCVFIHYSNANIHDMSLLDALRSPIFMAYYHDQPFNDNHLRPCPMLENPECIEDLVERTGAHSTELIEPESVYDLTAKTRPAAEAWAPVAERLWTDEHDDRAGERHRNNLGMAETDLHKFKREGREIKSAFDKGRDKRSVTDRRADSEVA
jgi:MoaA/NifB/PqqE/SkfB family radical SAM enzyme